MGTHLYFVMATPKEGEEEAFNHWYETQHAPDVLRVPGFVSCKRVKLNAAFDHTPVAGSVAGMPGHSPYIAIYTIEADDPAVCIAELRSRLGTPQMPSAGLTDPTKGGRALYDVICEIKG